MSDGSGGVDLTDDGLDSLIDAMSKMKKPEELEGKTFEQQLEVC